MIVIACMGTSLSSLAQSSKLDSLEQTYHSLEDKMQKLITGKELMDFYYRQGKSGDALNLAPELLSQAETLNDKATRASIHNRLGTIYNNIGGKDGEAMEQFSKALDTYVQLDDKYGLGVVYNNLGNVYRDLSYDSKALEFYTKSLEMCKAIGDREGEAFALKNIGIEYELQKWFDKSLQYHLLALEIRKELNIKSQVISSLLNVGISYSNLQEHELALQYFLEARDLERSEGSELLDEIVAEIGLIHQKKGQYDLAAQQFEEALEKSIAFKKYKTGSQVLYYLVNVYMNQGNMQKAANCLSQMNALLDTIPYLRGKVFYYDALYRLDSLNGNELQSLRTYRKKALLQDSLAELNNAEEVLEKSHALDLLRKEQELAIQKERQHYQNYLFLGITVSLLLALTGLLFYVLQKMRANKMLKYHQQEIEIKNRALESTNETLQKTIVDLHNANETIAKQNEEIKSQNESLENEVQIRTKELVENNQQLEQFAFMTAHNLRGPIARLLGLGHLFKLTNRLDEKEELVEKFIKSVKDIDVVISDLNRILEIKTGMDQLVSPLKLSQKMENIMQLLSEEIKNYSVEVNMDFSAADEVNSISPYIESIFYNLTSNAIKYQHRDRNLQINISSAVKNGMIEISFTDNGLGIDMDKFGHEVFSLYKRFHSHIEGRGMGLFLVKSQVEALGGHIKVKSVVNQGTTFMFTFRVLYGS
ncbi:MAG: sensor histidine kinase [Cyclobacteriaceae bacterium]|nr:sensor histidine kinase [Cyclobacteriaceae bacterium]